MPKSFAVIESENARIKSALNQVVTAVSAFYAFREPSDKPQYRINTWPDSQFMYFKLSYVGVPRTCLIRYNRKNCKLDLFLKQSSEVRADHLVFAPETMETHTLDPREAETYVEIEHRCLEWLKPLPDDDRLVNQPQIPTLRFPPSRIMRDEVAAARIERAELSVVHGGLVMRLTLETWDPEHPIVHEVPVKETSEAEFGSLAGKYFITNQNDFAILDAIRYKRHFVEIETSPLKGMEHVETQNQATA